MSMEYRLRRTLPSDRVAIIMPVDHGLIFDRIEGLERPSSPFATWGKSSDVTGFMMTPGQVRQSARLFAAHPHLTRVLTIDTYYDYREQDGRGSHGLITTVEDAVRMGVDAVAQTIRSGARGVIVGCNIWQRELSQGKRVLEKIGAFTRERKFND
ncbi:hypothetical protein [Robbsia sp. KACC 23696]|uniref:hypothetical protein n=1 Tax=Robbsia sp. KACC 23696 TaxID=3149231 RepID=UPI00325B9FD1